MTDQETPLPHIARGKRPHVFDDAAVDHLVATVLELASEVWTLRDRQAAMEAYMERHHGLDRAAFEAFEMPERDSKALSAERAAFVRRIFRTLEAEV